MRKQTQEKFWTKTKRLKTLPRDHDGNLLLKPCLEWTGGTDQKGYGVFRVPSGETLTPGVHRSHRVSFWIKKGPFPKKAQIDHKCRNRKCVEITHLILLGPVEHAKISNEDKYGKDRRKSGKETDTAKSLRRLRSVLEVANLFFRSKLI